MAHLDPKKLDQVVLDGPNYAVWYEKLRGSGRLLDCWDVIEGDTRTWVVTQGTPQSGTTAAVPSVLQTGIRLLPYPTEDVTNTLNFITDNEKRPSAQAKWNTKNSEALSLLQMYTTSTIWATINSEILASDAFQKLKTRFKKAGGAQTYLQLINCIHATFTDSKELSPQIQLFQDNYNKINSNGHSTLSEDLAVFMLTSALPKKYQATARLYIDNIDDITKFRLSEIIARVTAEEARQRAMDLNASHSASTSKISTTKSYNQKCDICGRNNHSTANHWPDGKPPAKGGNNKGRGNKGKGKAKDTKGKGKGKGKGKPKKEASVNSLRIIELPDVNVNSMESITVSCYLKSEFIKWMMDSGCTQHVTNTKEDFLQYQEFQNPGKVKLAGSDMELPIIGIGKIQLRHIMTNGKSTNLTLENVLYIPGASNRFYSPTVATETGCVSTISFDCHSMSNSDKAVFITAPRNHEERQYYFSSQLMKVTEPKSTISAIKPLDDYTLWHRRLGHAHRRVIKQLPQHVKGSPKSINLPENKHLCDGCEIGKSKRFPFPPSSSRAKNALDLVHCDLDEMTFTSIDKFKFTATFLDDATSFGIMYLLKSKDQQFEAFKSYKAWAERQLNTTLKCIRSDRGTEFLNTKQKEYLAENGIEHQTSMPYSQQQNGRAERFQQTIVNKANSMRLSAGLSDGFWSYATLAAVHVYNRTPII